MRVQATALRYWKAAEDEAQYQDAHACAAGNSAFAVADGVTFGTFRSAQWARSLVDSFVQPTERPELPAGLDVWIDELARHWLDAQLRDPPIGPDFHVERLLEMGAAATLLGVELGGDGGSDLGWKSLAIGDCVLLQLRDSRIISPTPFPSIRNPKPASPAVLATTARHGSRLRNGQWQIQSGTLLPGDKLLLATDAVGYCIAAELSEVSETSMLTGTLVATILARDQRGFRAWLDAARLKGRIEDDDSTVLLVETEPFAAGEQVPVASPPAALPVPAPQGSSAPEQTGQRVRPRTPSEKGRRSLSRRGSFLLGLLAGLLLLPTLLGAWALAQSFSGPMPSPHGPSPTPSLSPEPTQKFPESEPLASPVVFSPAPSPNGGSATTSSSPEITLKPTESGPLASPAIYSPAPVAP